MALLLTVSLFACGGGKTYTTSSTDAQELTSVETVGQEQTTPVSEITDDRDTAVETEPEPVSGTENLEISEKEDHVIIAGKGGCTDTDIVIPSHINGKPVTVIDEDAFCESDITSISIPWTVTKIDEDAFVDCKNLTKVTFSEGLRYIATSAFYGCSALESLTLPASLERVSDYAFRGCASLKEVLILGNTTLGNGAFEDCISLKSLTVRSSGSVPYKLGSSVCSQCPLETLVLGEGLTSIGTWAFSNLASLTEITLPVSLNKVDACAFLRSAITKVYYAGSEDQWKAIEIKSSNEPLQNAEIIYNNH